VYLIDWDNIQESVLLGQCGVQFTGNLGTATSRGFDIQANYRPIAGLSFETAIGHTDAHFTRSLTFGQLPVISAGDGLEIVPWTIAFGVEKSLPLFDDRAYIRLDDEYKARINKFSESRDPRNQSYDSTLVPPPALNFLSLRAGVALDSLNVSAFVDNLLNSHPQLTYTHQDRYTLLYQATTFRPMTVGVTATYSFR
jgi:iron complex outermembrane recepter protein